MDWTADNPVRSFYLEMLEALRALNSLNTVSVRVAPREDSNVASVAAWTDDIQDNVLLKNVSKHRRLLRSLRYPQSKRQLNETRQRDR
jgi:hypothetical protein